jgi:DNA-binding NarL/FixJ family response regulator
MKILIISGMQTIREKLKQLLSAQPDVEIVKEAEDNLSGLQAIKGYAFDVAVIDLLVPLRIFTETIRRMLSIKPSLKIIALSMYSDRRYLDQCLQAGVCGYLLKDCAYEDLADAVRTVASGRQYFSSSIGKHAAEEPVRRFNRKIRGATDHKSGNP